MRGLTVKVGGGSHVGVVPGVDAGGVGLEAQVAVGRIHEQRGVGNVADPGGGEGRGATVVEGAGGVVIRCHLTPCCNRRCSCRACTKCPAAAAVQPSCRSACSCRACNQTPRRRAADASRVAAQRAVVERATVRPAAAVARRVAAQRAVVERAAHAPPPLPPARLAELPVSVQL